MWTELYFEDYQCFFNLESVVTLNVAMCFQLINKVIATIFDDRSLIRNGDYLEKKIIHSHSWRSIMDAFVQSDWLL